MRDKPNEQEPLPFSIPHNPFEQSQRFVLIELAITEMRIGPSTYFKLATLASADHIDAGRRQPLEMIVESIGIDGVDGLLTAFEAVLNKRQQHPILVVVAVEKRADMTWMPETLSHQAE